MVTGVQTCALPICQFFYQNTVEERNPDASGKGSVWRLMPFVDNAFSILKVENENQARTAAAAFGEYARFLSDLDTAKLETIIPNFHNADFRIQQFRDSLKKDDPSVFRFKKAEFALDFIEKRLPFFENKNLNLPQRATHNDTKISNILFDKKTAAATCIIDLDTLQSGEILSDFGDMVRTYTPQYDEDFDADLSLVEMRFSYFEALAEGFLSEIGNVLTDSERKNLVFGAKRTVFVQALRFLTDYLNGDIYYKTERPDHNLARTRNQIALLKSIEKQADRMETTVAEIFISNKIKQ